jgi:hypothetical protein
MVVPAVVKVQVVAAMAGALPSAISPAAASAETVKQKILSLYSPQNIRLVRVPVACEFRNRTMVLRHTSSKESLHFETAFARKTGEKCLSTNGLLTTIVNIQGVNK